MLHTMNKVGECWECGEARREAEEKKRQAYVTRFLEDE
jgi:hypothetical protein